MHTVHMHINNAISSSFQVQSNNSILSPRAPPKKRLHIIETDDLGQKRKKKHRVRVCPCATKELERTHLVPRHQLLRKRTVLSGMLLLGIGAWFSLRNDRANGDCFCAAAVEGSRAWDEA